MLQFFRQFAQTTVAKIIFVILIVSFAVWGVGDIFRDGSRTGVAVVGDEVISPQQLANAFGQEMERMQPSFGQLTPRQAVELGALDRSMGYLLTRALFNAELEDMGLSMSQERLLEILKEAPVFQDQFGQFNRERYHEFLAKNGLREEDLLRGIKQDKNREAYLNAMTAGVQPNNIASDLLYRFDHETRNAQYVKVMRKDFQIAAPSDEQLEMFKAQNIGHFMNPEYRRLTILSKRMKDVQKEVQISDEELKAAYEARQNQFAISQPLRSLTQAVFAKKQDAEKAYDLLMGGTEFIDLYTEFSDSAPDFSTLTKVTKDQLPEELQGTIFGTEKAGDVLKPFETPKGWHIVKILESEEPRVKPFAEVRTQLRKDLMHEKVYGKFENLTRSLEENLATGATLEDAAKDLSMKTTTIDKITREGHNQNDIKIDNPLLTADLLASAFEGLAGTMSGIQEIRAPDGEFTGIYVVRVDEVIEAAPKPLNEVRKELTDAWYSQERSKLAASRAEEVAKRINEGENMITVAREMGFQLNVQNNVKRDDRQSPMTSRGVETLFTLNEPGNANFFGRDDYIVVQLMKVNPAQSPKDKSVLATTRSLYRAQIDEEILGQLRAALWQKFDVSINQNALRQFAAQ